VTPACIERDNTGGGDPSSSTPCTTSPTTPPVVVIPPVVEEPQPEENNHGCKANIVHAYPNPFKDKLKLEWIAPKSEKVRLEIYDSRGHRIAMVYEGNVIAGNRYSFDWSAMGMKDHVYYYRYTSSKSVDHGKLVRKK
jgi:hypothetical protein